MAVQELTETVESEMAGPHNGHPFSVILTHDVDRPYKTYQGVHRAMSDGDPHQLRSLITGERPYWRFEDVMEMESERGLRSSFYMLQERKLFRDIPRRRWIDPRAWIRYTGHYSVSDPRIASIIRRLDDGGWEVGLHGSFDSWNDPDLLADEKRTLEAVLGRPVHGGRQHFLRLDRPETWTFHRDIGLNYDASLGSSSEYGFQHGYDPRRPFNDDFLVFPLTVMEVALMKGAGGVEPAKQEIDRLLAEAERYGATMTVLWHVRLFNDAEFPGYRELYGYLLDQALDADAWIGPAVRAYERWTDTNQPDQLTIRPMSAGTE